MPGGSDGEVGRRLGAKPVNVGRRRLHGVLEKQGRRYRSNTSRYRSQCPGASLDACGVHVAEQTAVVSRCGADVDNNGTLSDVLRRDEAGNSSCGDHDLGVAGVRLQDDPVHVGVLTYRDEGAANVLRACCGTDIDDVASDSVCRAALAIDRTYHAVDSSSIATTTASLGGQPCAARAVIELTDELLPVANRTVISDVATTARVNVEVNLPGIPQSDARFAFIDALTSVEATVSRADRITTQVRKQLNS